MGALQQSKPGSEEVDKSSVITLQDSPRRRRLAKLQAAQDVVGKPY